MEEEMKGLCTLTANSSTRYAVYLGGKGKCGYTGDAMSTLVSFLNGPIDYKDADAYPPEELLVPLEML